MAPKHTPGPWYVLDFRATHLVDQGWICPAIDRILITNKQAKEIEACAGADCVIARIQFDNRPEQLTEFNLADARLIAAAPELLEALKGVLHIADRETNEFDAARAAIAKAEGRTP